MDKEKVYILISGGNLQAAWARYPHVEIEIIDEDNGNCDKPTAKENKRKLKKIERELKKGNLHNIY